MSEGLDSASQRVANDIRSLADQIVILAEGLKAKNPRLAQDAAQTAADMVLAFVKADGSFGGGKVVSIHAAALDTSRSEVSDSVNEFILAAIADARAPLSVQQIVDLLDEAGFEIQRPSLVVKLNRLVNTGLLVKPTTGHFRVSDSVGTKR